MTKEQALDILRLIAAMESAMFVAKAPIPDYMLDQIAAAVDALYAEVLK